MTAKELIGQLEVLIALRGDMTVTCDDGMDPSDECEITHVNLKDGSVWFDKNQHLNKSNRIYIQS